MPPCEIHSRNQRLLKAETQKPVVRAKNIGVKYVLGSKRDDIQSRTFDMLLRRSRKNELLALKDVSFIGYPGEIIGIIGSNGAGKTTLCRVISGLIRPDYGKIKVRGEISALLSLGTGFNNLLSGRENILLNGMMLGFSKKNIVDLSQEIIDFSELGHFIDEPIKNYSNGMRSRLAFSIAAMMEPELFIIDEALSHGDYEFTQKSGQKLQQLIKKSKIVMVVSHNIRFIQKYCTRVLWIDEGLLKANGDPYEVIEIYQKTYQYKNAKPRAVYLQETENRTRQIEVVKVRNIGLKYSLVSKKVNKNGSVPNNRMFQAIRRKAFWPLKNISFSLKQGEILGIIGRNGAGKTTLCRILSGILKPDQGKISIDGQITALLTFGAGFNNQLTGTDNVYLNGMILGIPKNELKHFYPRIVEFSGLSKFMDQPVKNYSSGMRSRLGFSIAAMVKPDIFIIDEALNAGDINFYEKASSKIQELVRGAKAVIVVTHNMPFVKKVCTRAIWLHDGFVKSDGSSQEVAELYIEAAKKNKIFIKA